MKKIIIDLNKLYKSTDYTKVIIVVYRTVLHVPTLFVYFSEIFCVYIYGDVCIVFSVACFTRQFEESINAAGIMVQNIEWSQRIQKMIMVCNIKLGLFCGYDINCGIPTSWTRTISPTIVIIICLNLLHRPNSPSKPVPENYFCTYHSLHALQSRQSTHACMLLASSLFVL